MQRPSHIFDLELQPAGIFKWNEETKKKEPIKANIKLGSPWRPEYNMGKVQLVNSKYIVLDIDGDASFKFNPDDTISCSINNKQYKLPLTAYTQTTKPGNYHFWYLIPVGVEDRPARITDLVPEKIDVFASGIIFEWHNFSPMNEFHLNIPLKIAPLDWYNDMVKISSLNKLTGNQSLSIVPSHARANVVKEFLALEGFHFEGRGHRKKQNTFFKLVFPKSSLPTTESGAISRKIDWNDFTLSHDLINKIATKLSTTAQLDTFEHVYPTLHKIVEAMIGNKYDPVKTQTHIQNNILVNLPEHPAITSYDDDLLTLEEELQKQSGNIKLARTVVNGELKYVRIDSITLKPILMEGVENTVSKHNIIISRKIAEKLHPEFLSADENGRPHWDDSLLPWIKIVNDIYRPRSFIDEENNFMPVLNEYTPNKYYEEATPVKVKPDNVYMRAIEATIGKDNIMWRRDTTQPNHKGIMISAIDYYHHYMARVMFGDRPPAIKLWMAAPTRAEGAAGKSLAGIEFPSKVMGRVVVQQTAENINKGWGDNIVNARLISIEDLEKLTPNDFNKFYGVLKRIGTNSIARLNMKGNNYVDLKLKVAMSLSTNWRPLLPQSDRWIVALEPAWLNGKAERLSQEDISLIIDKLESDEHDQEAQDVVNYWYHLWLNERELYKNDITTFAPITAYRIKWVTQTTKNTKNIIPLLPEPNDLFGLIKDGYCPIDCFKFLVANYQEKTRQTALPWKWFAEFLKSVAPDSMEGTKNGKSTIAGLLEIDWENPGVLYNKWHQNPEWEAKAGITKGFTLGWAVEGYRFFINPEEIEIYKRYIIENDIEDGLGQPNIEGE